MNSTIQDSTLTQLIALAASNQDVAAVWLYGSRAKGNHRDDSDYDLGVLFKSQVDDTLEHRLRPELLAMDWSKSLGLNENQLSLVDVQNAPIPLAMNVISGTLLFCNDQSARLQAEGIIMSKAELDYGYHLKHFGS